MLSFQPIGNSTQAAHYFESADDYYTKEGHRGEWMGKGADELGLTQQQGVDRRMFKSILDGKLPDGRQVRPLHRRTTGNDRKGIDFTFSAPKSVSLQALIAGDFAVTEAHDAAVRRAFAQLEKLAYARVKEAGQSYRVRSGTLVASAFRHELSRAQDPQLHTHVVVANLTKRPDGEWRALSNEDMMANIKNLGAYYRAALGEELRSRGYELRESGRGMWELAHISDELIAHFSTRAKAIEAAFEARGIDRDSASTAQAQAVTLMTRPKKSEADREALRDEWIASAKDSGLDMSQLEGVKAAAHAPDRAILNTPEAHANARKVLDFSIEHLSERQGLFTGKELEEVALNHGATKSTVEAMQTAVKDAETDGRLVRELPLYQTAKSMNQAKELAAEGHFMDTPEISKLTRSTWIAVAMNSKGLSEERATQSVDNAIARGALVPLEARYTTPKAQALERAILGIERDGRGVLSPILSPETLAAVKTDNLNAGQAEAVKMILGTRNRYVGVQGFAGTGKSHMLNAAMEQITQVTARESATSGFKVIGLAPYGSQVHALKELGVEAKTLASFLANPRVQSELGPRSVVVLDEAGVVPAHQMADLMRLVERSGARMVMLGDVKQTGAVEAGKPFAQMQEAGMMRSLLTDIQRQKTPDLKAAVLDAAADKTTKALMHLGSRIVQIKEHDARYTEIANTYLALSPAERAQTLIVTGTNEARRQVNTLVRAGLNLKGSKDYEVLETVDATRAQLKLTATYETGMKLIYHGKDQGLKKGELYTVVGKAGEKVLLEDGAGQKAELIPTKHLGARLYETMQVKFAPRDVLRVTNTDKTLGVTNGDMLRVTSVSASGLVATNDAGKTITFPPGKPLHVQHGYTTTTHSSQGLTAKRVLIDAHSRFLTTNRATFYVSISRPRIDLRLFTDNQTDLRRAVARVPKKFAALELRTAYSEANIANQKHRQIAVNRLKALTVQLQKKSTTPKPAQPNLSVALGRRIR